MSTSNRDRALESQNNEEFVEINSNGSVSSMNTQAGPREKGAALRDPKGEY